MVAGRIRFLLPADFRTMSVTSYHTLAYAAVLEIASFHMMDYSSQCDLATKEVCFKMHGYSDFAGFHI